MDVDLCGPSIPRIFNVVNARVMQNSTGWSPIRIEHEEFSLSLMSIGFLLPNQDDAVVWRGPKKTGKRHTFGKLNNHPSHDWSVY